MNNHKPHDCDEKHISNQPFDMSSVFVCVCVCEWVVVHIGDVMPLPD